MDNKRPTVYEECRQKGISRRDFLKFCTTMAAFMGLEASGVAQVVNALETKPRLPVIWLHLQVQNRSSVPPTLSWRPCFSTKSHSIIRKP